MITVLSQDKKTVMKSNVFTVDGKTIRGYSKEFCTTPDAPDNGITLASYSTEERAKEVLNHLSKVMGSGTNKMFRLPIL